jgi:trehalose synthase
MVIQGNPRFFEITKRIHNGLYGYPGDGGPLGPVEHADYEAAAHENLDRLLPFVNARDVVVLHDPQTAGLAPAIAERGATIVWRCHVGVDIPNEHSEAAWAFLLPYLDHVDGYVFSRAPFAPPFVPRDRLAVIPPSIDPFSAKNVEMHPTDVRQVLQYVGLVAGGSSSSTFAFTRRDGTRGTIDHPVDDLGTDPAPADVPLVVQVSRWDTMKDMRGVMEGFAAHLGELRDAHLMLSGPDPRGVTDDPEGNAVLDDCLAAWQALPVDARRRVHLSCVPMVDADAAAVVCNALQRHATIVVQKSLAEGFGLTVAEAMWKTRPVVASAVGGIVDQVVPGETGLLLDDPDDLDAFGDALHELLADAAGAAAMGERGHHRANELFLGDTHLERWADLVGRLAGS